jgi:uncharacterized protein
MSSIPPTPRTRVNRLPARGSYDRAAVYAILDEALSCHVGFVTDGQPFVIPTIHARIGDRLYVHGAMASRMLSVMSKGVPLCVTVTLVDGLVLARSAFHHSMNYRSVVILGTAQDVTDPEEKGRALDAIVEHVMPGRLAEVRAPNESELKRTRVLSLPIEEASAKIRTGPRFGPVPRWTMKWITRSRAGPERSRYDSWPASRSPTRAFCRERKHPTPWRATPGGAARGSRLASGRRAPSRATRWRLRPDAPRIPRSAPRSARHCPKEPRRR